MFKKNKAKFCPLIKKPCIGSECMWAVQMRGTDPISGGDIDDEACAVTWLPMLLTENVKASHETAAATESFRNEMVAANSASVAILAKSLVPGIGDKT
ncbi:MAG: hypothetical protein AB9Q19_12535 [Candidatus Reddybacter sp.]